MDLMTYAQVVKFILMNYRTDEIITKAESAIMTFAQQAQMRPTVYAGELFMKVLRCGEVYEEYVRNEMFMKWLDSSLRQSTSKNWSAKKKAILQYLAFHVCLLLGLQGTNYLAHEEAYYFSRTGRKQIRNHIGSQNGCGPGGIAYNCVKENLRFIGHIVEHLGNAG